MVEPINTRWKAALPAMEEAFGGAWVRVMLNPLIPLRYAGETLILGAPSPFLRDYVMRHLSTRIGKILGGPVVVEISDIAKKAEARRRATARAN